jgi:hypothetical protein
MCLTQFSYSELVLLASFFLKDHLDSILNAMNGDLPDELIEMLNKLADEQED